MRDESLVDNHRFGPTTHLLGNHEDLKRIAAVDPKLALEYELQIYIDKGKFLTIKDRRRMNELLELTKSPGQLNHIFDVHQIDRIYKVKQKPLIKEKKNEKK